MAHSCLWQVSFEVLIISCGALSVGKTSLIQRYVNGRAPAKYRPTIGADVENKTLSVLGRNRTLQVMIDAKMSIHIC